MRLSFRRATGADIGLRHKQVRLCGGRLARNGALETANCLGELALFEQRAPEVGVGVGRPGKSREHFFERCDGVLKSALPQQEPSVCGAGLRVCTVAQR